MNHTKKLIDPLKPAGKPGRPPVVRHCPYCHQAMNVTAMRRHRPDCAREHLNAPPQPPRQAAPEPTLPTDIQNQIPSDDPLKRPRQADEREQERIQRS